MTQTVLEVERTGKSSGQGAGCGLLVVFLDRRFLWKQSLVEFVFCFFLNFLFALFESTAGQSAGGFWDAGFLVSGAVELASGEEDWGPVGCWGPSSSTGGRAGGAKALEGRGPGSVLASVAAWGCLSSSPE